MRHRIPKFALVRILVNTRFLLAGKLEGIGLYTLEVLERLVRQHPQHTFYFAFDRPFDNSFVSSPNVVPLVLYPPARHPVLFYCWFEIAIPRAYEKHQCDVFISPDGFTSLSPKVKKNILVIHDLAYLHYPKYVPPVMRWYYRHFMPKFIKVADSIVTISHTSSDDIKGNFPLAAGKVRWAYNGIREMFKPASTEAQESTRREWSDGCEYILVLGAIHPRKNTVSALKAFDLAREQLDTPLKLIVVGRAAWQTGILHDTLQTMHHKQDVIMAGYVNDSELVQLLGAASTLLYISLWEGFGLPLLEAMACGTPVITSDLSSMVEVGGDACVLVDPLDISGVADAIQRVIDDREVASDLVEKGLNRVQQFSWQDQVDLLSSLLEPG